MDTIDNLFISEINRVLTTFPSIYSNNDVVSLLENLKLTVLDAVSKEKTTSGITEEQFQEFNANVRHALERVLYDSDQVVDIHSAEFSIDYDNRISVENISVNADFVTEELDEIMLDRFQEAFGELIITNEPTI
jgi:hypothetical protein